MSFIEDFLDPGNFLHKTHSESLAEKQFEYEKELAEKNYAHQLEVDDFNVRMQQEAFDYQKKLNQMQMEREDNAIQRRIADLKESGLSPTLAAGSPASATPVRAGTAPQSDAHIALGAASDVKVRAAMFKEQMAKDRMTLAMGILSNMSDISQTKAQTEYIKAKTGEQDVINRYLDDYLSERNKGIGLENAGKVLANDFAEYTFSLRAEELEGRVANLKESTDKLHWESILAHNDSLRKVYYDMKAEAEAKLANSRISQADADAACKAYTLKYAEDRGIPLNGINQWQVVYDIIHDIRDWFVKPSGNNNVPDDLKKYLRPNGDFDWNTYMQDMSKDEVPPF